MKKYVFSQTDVSRGEENEYENVNNINKKKNLKYIAVAIVICCCLAALIAVIVWVILHETNQDEPDIIAEATTVNPLVAESLQRRIDCYPETEGGVVQVDAVACQARSCIWDPVQDTTIPACYVPQPNGSVSFGYRVVANSSDDSFGRYSAADTVQTWKLQSISENAIYGRSIPNLTFKVHYISDTLVRFKFVDDDNPNRYQVPVPLSLTSNDKERLYTVEVSTEEPFSFKIIRNSTGAVLWDTSVGGFAFTDQFLQIATRLPSSNIYGLGENLHESFKHDMNYVTWPLFSRDQPSASSDQTFRANLYGVHPYYECLEEDGNAHGVLLLNSNAMDYTLSPLPMLTYKTIGGILDFYMVLGPEPEAVVQQYTQLVGRPYMPPYWMLGFQLCRYGYTDTDDMRAAVNRTLYYNIPYDVQYADIDHMYKQRDFTIDQEAFGDLPEYFQELRSMGLKTIIILDPALEINDTYEPYVDGLAEDIFITWPNMSIMPVEDYEEYNNTNMMGYVWPEWKVVFPDFFKNKTAELWTEWITDFIHLLNFDALWIDMNEPANFGTNEIRPWNWPENDTRNWSLKCPSSKWDDPPYRTKAAYIYDNKENERLERISAKTLCMVGVQGDNEEYLHYDVHSLYGWKQAEVSLQSMRAAVKAVYGSDLRSMILTRSSFPGTGQYAGRWLGDNRSAWKDMHLSIIGSLEFNIMGIPYIGADICGFFDDSTPELCLRWQELGAFYTFARNHNTFGAEAQDPGYFGDEVGNRTRETLLIRYKLLPYLYTLFHKAHTVGCTVIRPLFHEFPRDSNTWSIDRQFLWGSALLISPILDQLATFTYYLPAGTWYNWYNYEPYNDNTGRNTTLSVTMETPIQLHIRGGHILPWQEPANNTNFSRQNDFGLLVALNQTDGEATGDLFWDDGDSIDTYVNMNYYFATFMAQNNTLNFTIVYNGIEDEMSVLHLDTVHILGVSQATVVQVNDTEHEDFTYDNIKQSLLINNLQQPMNMTFTLFWK